MIKELNAMKRKVKYGDIFANISREEYREFKSEEEAEQWGQEKYKNWTENYKKIFHINEILRRGETENITSNRMIYISTLTMAIFSAPIIDETVVLYRQVPEEMIQEMISLNKENDCCPYEEKGFMSTSMVKSCCAKKCGDHKCILKMYVDNRTPIHAIYANLIRKRDEEELLLPPGLFLEWLIILIWMQKQEKPYSRSIFLACTLE